MGPVNVEVCKRTPTFLAVALLVLSGAAFGDDTTWLHEAVKAERWELVRAMLDAGADVSARDNDGETPLSVAVAEDQAEIVCLLREAGAK